MKETYQDYFGNTIYLTFDERNFRKPGHVLILPLIGTRLVFTRHKERGIELPGGKIEQGETPLAAAVREVYEEIGASLQEIRLVGQYSVSYPDRDLVKSIYIAKVEELLDIPFDSDTTGPLLFDHLPVEIEDKEEFSPYMKDGVYKRTLEVLGLIKKAT